MFSERVQSRAAARDETRAKVLASAERLFRGQGFADTTIRQIAADAGVSTGTVMGVGDKDGLLIEVFDDWIATIHRDRQSGDESPDSLTPDGTVDAVMGLLAPFLRYFAEDPALSRQYSSIIVRGSHESAIFRDLAVALVAELEAVLARAGLAEAEAARGARVVYFAYLGIVMTGGNHASGGASVPDQLRDVVRCVIQHPLQGDES
ncbi:TetR family transcriptional regulator [Mycobacterium sp. CBMA 234]|uniref:TetR/AcrR family transcriptional regulator n=1 Tax=Mycolicibacterium sp. CBMA 234 TaxID=1918495 RepID=UPI0012DE4BD6|nr:TetR/AcrR family transcriptional regulator [Mycolicibacterium sp. CBMA 234]MUL63867.1 TetR family transcriptional regulator [Mycolicibacterium sp. CBMA 234]